MIEIPYSWGAGADGSTSDNTLHVYERSPGNGELGVEPFTQVYCSVRSGVAPVSTLRVLIDGVLAYDLEDAGFQRGFSGTAIINAFNGLDVTISHAEWEFDAVVHSCLVIAGDRAGYYIEEAWSFTTRGPVYSNYRYALPVQTQSSDPITMQFLKVWDGIHAYVQQRTTGRVAGGGLFDIDKIPHDALEMAFEDVGLVYPNFTEISDDKKRRLLKNADAVHSTRYTAMGLQFYISLLTDASVVVERLNRGFFLYWNSESFGFPTAAMMNTSGTNNDICTYFIGPREQSILVTITGSLSDDMKDFLKQTISREIPMCDDPVNLTQVLVRFLS